MDHIPPPSNYGYFTDQARRAGYTAPEYGRTHHDFFRDHHHPDHLLHHRPFPHPQQHPHPHPQPHPSPSPNPYLYPTTHLPTHPHGMHEAIQREIEKERIREEIIMAEIARRRVLEAEVRRELMIERELALRRGIDGFPFTSSPVLGLESPMRLSALPTRSEGRSAEERFAMSLEEREGLEKRRDSGGIDNLPFQRRSAELRISEVKPVEGSKEKEKIILLAKPDESISGSKRKAVLPPGLDPSEISSDGILKKRAKEEWSCALCQVSATSEQGLNEHLQGKRHKSKEAALRAQRDGKNYSIGLFPKKARKSNQVAESTNPGRDGGVKVKAVYLPLKKTGEASSERDGLLTLHGNQNSDVQKMLKNDDSKKDIKSAEASSQREVVQSLKETPNSDDMKQKQPEVQEVQMNDDSKEKKLYPAEASSDREDLPPRLETRNSDDLERKQSEVQNVRMNDDNELKFGESSSKREDLQPLPETRNSVDMVKRQVKVQKVQKINDYEKKELKSGGTGSKRVAFPPLQESQNPGNLKKILPELQKVPKNDGLKKKGFYYWCQICHIGISSPQMVNEHKMGEKHADCLKLLGKSDQTGGVGSCTRSGKTAVVSHYADRFAEDGRSVMLDNTDQTLEQPMLEDPELMDGGVQTPHNVHEISLGESQSVDCGAVDAAKPDLDLNNGKFKMNGWTPDIRPLQETGNSEDFVRKQLKVLKEVLEVCNDDGSEKAELKIWEASSERKDLDPLQIQTSDDLERKQSEVLNVQKHNGSEKKELKIGEASSMRNDLQLLESQNLSNLEKKQSEVQMVQKNGDLKKKGFSFLCEICKMEITHPKHIDDHLRGKKHAKNVKLLGKSDQTGGIAKTADVSPRAEGVSVDGKTVTLYNVHQTLEKPRVEGFQPMVVVKPQHKELEISVGESHAEDCGAVDEVTLEHDMNYDKVELNLREPALQPLQDTQNSDDLKGKQSEVQELPKDDDSEMNELEILEASTKIEDLQSFQETLKSDNLEEKQSEVQELPKNDDSKMNELEIVEASSKIEDLKSFQETLKSDILERKQSEVQTVQMNDVSSKKEFKTRKASLKSDDLRMFLKRRKQFTWKRKPLEVETVNNNDASTKKEFEAGLASSKGDDPQPLPGSQYLFPCKGKPSEVQTVQKSDASSIEELKTGETSSKGDNVQSLPKSQSTLTWIRKQPESQTLEKNNFAKKERLSKFWCEICQVGTSTAKNMNDHKMGKKHIGRVKDLCKTYGVAQPVAPFVSKTISVSQHSTDKTATVCPHVGGVTEDGTVPLDNVDLTTEQGKLESHERIDGVNCVDRTLKQSTGASPIEPFLSNFSFPPYSEIEKTAALLHNADGVAGDGIAMTSGKVQQTFEQSSGAPPVAPFSIKFSDTTYTKNEKIAAPCGDGFAEDGNAVTLDKVHQTLGQPGLGCDVTMDDVIIPEVNNPMDESQAKDCGVVYAAKG